MCHLRAPGSLPMAHNWSPTTREKYGSNVLGLT